MSTGLMIDCICLYECLCVVATAARSKSDSKFLMKDWKVMSDIRAHKAEVEAAHVAKVLEYLCLYTHHLHGC